MSDSIRIRTTPNGTDNYLTLKLEQDFDFIEILSLKIRPNFSTAFFVKKIQFVETCIT